MGKGPETTLDFGEIGMIPFVYCFPEQAERETRVMHVPSGQTLPKDEYGLLETYCPDPSCDCRRVILNVAARHANAIVATINYGFDRGDEMAGPFLDPLNRQSQYSGVLLDLVTRVLADPAYVARLERHYRQVKEAAADPSHPIQGLLKRLAEAHDLATPPASPSSGETRRSRPSQRATPDQAEAREESVPKALRPVYEQLIGLTDTFCKAHLNDEYAQLCRRLAATLCRKRPSPVTQGRLEIWAGAIIYAMGSVNFLFDKSQSPHLRADELCQLLGVKQSTAANKSRTILNLLRIGPMDPRWYRPSKLADNPLAWMIEIDGFIVDVRREPREIQEEAFRRGLIPYLPG